MKLIFIGPQGSGKGTQAQILSKKLNLPHISTGDLMRGATGTLKQELDSYMEKGLLVPDELVAKILKQRISQPDCKPGFILDGFPRNLNQVKLLKQITNMDRVIEINISDQEAVKRISGRLTCEDCKAGFNELTSPKPKNKGICDNCNGKLIRRPDDTEQAVIKRLQIYHNETKPILNEYKDILITINGERDIDKIAEDIIEKLD